jgi:hypothetical protein
MIKKRIIQSKSPEELLDEALPKSAIIQAHKDLFNAKKTVVIDGNITMVADGPVQVKAVALAYQILGVINPRKMVIETSPHRNLKEIEKEEQERLKQLNRT